MKNKDTVKIEIMNKYPEFPIELLDLIVQYVNCDIAKDCKTMGITHFFKED